MRDCLSTLARGCGGHVGLVRGSGESQLVVDYKALRHAQSLGKPQLVVFTLFLLVRGLELAKAVRGRVGHWLGAAAESW